MPLPSQLPSLDEVRAERARRSLYAFTTQAWPYVDPTPLKANWHLGAIAEHLEAVVAGEIGSLLINMPPRLAKSLEVGVFFPAWCWIDHPELRFLSASYKLALAIRDATKARDLMQGLWYQSAWGDRFAFADDQNQKTYYKNDHNGHRVVTATGAGGTGEGGDILLIDDPHSRDDAQSQAKRESQVDFVFGTMTTRANEPDKLRRVMVMQRLHESDASGVAIERGGWVHLCLPMEYDPKRHCQTVLGWQDPRTEPGELLHPTHVGPAAIPVLKSSLGSYSYAGEYQQRPAPAEGGIVQRAWLKFWAPLAQIQSNPDAYAGAVPLPYELDEQIQSWDMTFKATLETDFVVGQVWGRKLAGRYLLDQVRDRLTFTQTQAAVRELSAKWPDALAKLVEDKANGPAIIDSLAGEIPGIVPVNPEGDKVARMRAVTPLMEAGNVYLPHPRTAPWVRDLLERLVAFPNAADDEADALSQALRRFQTGGGGVQTAPAIYS